MPANPSPQPQHQTANRALSARVHIDTAYHPSAPDQSPRVNRHHGNPSLAVQIDLVLQELAGLGARILPPDIDLRVTVPRDLWPILGDSCEIHGTLINLLLNARVAMPAQGELTISARNATVREIPTVAMAHAHPGDYVEVAISHSGSAIYQSPMDKGVGLRLAQMARMLHCHRGFARLGSRAGGRATLCLYLPRARRARKSTVTGTGAAAPTGASILVVDDATATLASHRDILTRAGYRVLIARGGHEALTHFTRCPDLRLVLTHLAIPGVNGFTLIWALRRSKPDLRLIVATNHCSEDNHGELARLGVRQVLLKPFSSRQLLDAVSGALIEPVQCEPDLFLVEAAAAGR